MQIRLYDQEGNEIRYNKKPFIEERKLYLVGRSVPNRNLIHIVEKDFSKKTDIIANPDQKVSRIILPYKAHLIFSLNDNIITFTNLGLFGSYFNGEKIDPNLRVNLKHIGKYNEIMMGKDIHPKFYIEK